MITSGLRSIVRPSLVALLVALPLGCANQGPARIDATTAGMSDTREMLLKGDGQVDALVAAAPKLDVGLIQTNIGARSRATRAGSPGPATSTRSGRSATMRSSASTPSTRGSPASRCASGCGGSIHVVVATTRAPASTTACTRLS